jgi:hypothetical protein
MKPHRGVLILVLGILGIVVCPFMSIASWVMGKGDLAAMDAGQMDPEGKGLTKAGYILGIVGVCLAIVGILFGALFFLVLVGASAS